MVLFSDGVTEAEDPAQAFFGRDRLLSVLEAQRRASPAEMVEAVLGAVQGFSGDMPQTDDITLLALKRA